MIAVSSFPIYLGGEADVLQFKNHIDGIAYVTAGLIGCGGQPPSNIGEYELAMCVRNDDHQTLVLLSKLSHYTLEHVIQPGDTMDVAPAMPDGSQISSLLFTTYREFEFQDNEAGILLGIGITQAEFKHCQEHGPEALIQVLNDKNIFPYTEYDRTSVLR